MLLVSLLILRPELYGLILSLELYGSESNPANSAYIKSLEQIFLGPDTNEEPDVTLILYAGLHWRIFCIYNLQHPSMSILYNYILQCMRLPNLLETADLDLTLNIEDDYQDEERPIPGSPATDVVDSPDEDEKRAWHNEERKRKIDEKKEELERQKKRKQEQERKKEEEKKSTKAHRSGWQYCNGPALISDLT